MEHLITQAREEFEQILSNIKNETQNQQLHEVEKGIFSSLLKLGRTLLSLYLQSKGTGHKGKVHMDQDGIKRSYHSIKHRSYHSIFGKISIGRACYWRKGRHEVHPLDAELNLPAVEQSYVLQEWGAALGCEEPYTKAAQFLETILGSSLWGSSIESIINKACVDVPNFYEEREGPDPKTENEILVATIDGKGVVMRKGQIVEPSPKKHRKRMRKIGEKQRLAEAKNTRKPGRKKMSTVVGVYTIAPNKRNPEMILDKVAGKQDRPRPKNKVLQATLKGKDEAALRLKKEVCKRDPEKEKPGVALMDGEHKLRELVKTHLPWFVIIIDIYHVIEYLWIGAHIFHQKSTPEAERWVKDKLSHLLHGKIEQIIDCLNKTSNSLSKGKKDRLQKVITYLENGKEHMYYNIYLSRGYPIGSGVVEGACKNLVKDRMEQSGMQWTKFGAEALLSMRSIQVNKMTGEYWKYHISQERQRLYSGCVKENSDELAA